MFRTQQLTILIFLVAFVSSCPQNCLTCNADPSKCESCSPGYELTEITHLCEVSYTHQSEWAGVCNTGKKQSPINIDTSQLTLCPSSTEFYQDTKTVLTTIKPAGESLKAIYAAQSTVTYTHGGKIDTYNSLQFHWHAPSEHQVNGEYFDLELHIVHSNADGSGNLAVTGLLFKVDKDQDNDILDKYNFFADNSTHEFMFPIFLKNKLIYHYEGSLTTPPCSQIVNWFVYTEHFPLTKRNYYLLKHQINQNRSNSRYAQNLNGRNLQIFGGFCNPIIKA